MDEVQRKRMFQGRQIRGLKPGSGGHLHEARLTAGGTADFSFCLPVELSDDAYKADGAMDIAMYMVGAYVDSDANDRPDALAVPRPMHRIDKATGGLLVLGRTHAACASLADLV